MFKLGGLVPFGSRIEKYLIDRYLTRHFGVTLEHVTLSSNKWDVAVWPEDDVRYILDQEKDFNYEFNKLISEHLATDRNTVIRPDDFERKLGLPYLSASIKGLEDLPKPYNIQTALDNILPTAGMRIMAQRGTGDDSTDNSDIAVGDDATPEDLADTALGNELARKDIDTYGDRGVPTGETTEQYGLGWAVGDFPTDPDDAYEAGLFNDPAAGTLMAHVTFAKKTISTGKVMTTQINISHQNGTQV